VPTPTLATDPRATRKIDGELASRNTLPSRRRVCLAARRRWAMLDSIQPRNYECIVVVAVNTATDGPDKFRCPLRGYGRTSGNDWYRATNVHQESV